MVSDDGNRPKDHGLKQLSEAMKNAGLLNPVIRDDVFGGATKALRENSERWARIMEPFKLKPLIAPDVSARIAEWTKTQNALGNALSGVFKQVQAIDFKRIFSAFDWMIEEGRKAAMVEKSGWLPHHTTPFDLLESEGMEDDQIADLIAGYYAQEWAAVEQAFVTQLADYDLDDEAKETMREALSAHRQGLFRVAPRLLFPEIERVCSDAFFDGQRTITVPTKKGKQARLPITRLKEVWEMVRELPLGDLAAYEYSWQLFRKVEEHLYDEVGDDETARDKYRADPVPNRHAALHGIICYKTQQTSLNTIIMADFIFHLVSQLKKYAVEETTVDDAG
ncbi:MAG: hypothetical protein J0I80_10880 [Sphingomonas sp.]|nr:hypothetical protein [Sphingomonas sp.]